ncbi:hypothetical protein [Candidatus Nitrosocaldus islandicus]|uniref:hypothetical protein n=1 Tax=Candidatus Nitrosocaldus islandicus TaxID=2045011 RepID=UPI000CD0DB72|nr:hypothetical protein [Candidatus Nitrosocaldus islandicus]
MDNKVVFNKERAREAGKGNSSSFWNPSGDAEAVFEVLDEPRVIAKTGKMRRDAWVLDVRILYGKDYDSEGEIIELTGEKRALILNSKTVIESKVKRLIEQYKTLKGMRLVLIGLGEVEGENGSYIDFYINTEENAKKDGVVEVVEEETN